MKKHKYLESVAFIYFSGYVRLFHVKHFFVNFIGDIFPSEHKRLADAALAIPSESEPWVLV